MYFHEYCNEAKTVFGYAIKKRVNFTKSKFQDIEIFETINHGFLMVIDGFIMLTSRDNYFYHEVMGHSPIAAHPNAKDVLIIGGGDCGTLKEVLSHQSIATCTQIDIDEQVTLLAEKYFPELTERNNDPRALIKFDDGVNWVQQAADKSYDIIIIDSTDPVGPGEGLFNLEFHKECMRVLRNDGILIQQSESPLFQRTILEGIRKNFQNAGATEVVTLSFPQPCYPSGLWSATLASKRKINWEQGYKKLDDLTGPIKYLNSTMLKSLVLQSSVWPSSHEF